MKRNFLPLLAAGALLLGACNNSTETSTTETTTSDGTAMSDTAKSDMAMAGDSGSMSAGTGKGMGDPNGPTAPHATDAEFMMSAAHSDQNEIQQSKMALAKGVTGMAKEMADKMIADHTKSTAMLKPIADKKGVKLPTDMDAEHKAMAPMMEKMSGKDFEAKFMAQMVMDHQKTANTMRAHEKMTKDADLQGFISQTLPVVESHLQMAEKHANMKM